ncbi:MAG: CapA family protein [Anaerovoracaceae bacterium]|jgi:poly-gamma-glutamate capsule biosynthesis protein CapA/YwtB (metallophosphatase superfamily)
MKKRYFQVFTAVLAVIFLLTACGSGSAVSSSSETEKNGSDSDNEAVKVNILCVGDIIPHSSVIESALQDDGSYDFSGNYEYVEKYIEQADLAMCNMETTFGGGTPSGYPMFNAPDELAEDVHDVGFDVAFTSNNHMMDSGSDGVTRTVKVLRDAGLDVAGSRLSEDEKSYLVIEVNGAKIGIVAYTYETTASAGAKTTINGNSVSEETAELINSFNYHELDSEDYGEIGEDIEGCREDGADVVICYMHWGTEYQQDAGETQEEMAQKLADMGADVIFASHPHVPQEIEVVTSSSGEEVPVFYSMGNFISNQRQETVSNRYTEEGMMAEVKLTIMPGQDEILAESVNIIPTWVDKYTESGSTIFRIIPLDSHLGSNGALAMSGHIERAQQAEEDMESKFGEYIDGKTIFTSGGESDDSSKAA